MKVEVRRQEDMWGNKEENSMEGCNGKAFTIISHNYD